MKIEIDLFVWIGREIRYRREKLGLKHSDLANSLGLGRTSIVNLEKGRQEVPLKKLIKIAKILDCKIGDLLP